MEQYVTSLKFHSPMHNSSMHRRAAGSMFCVLILFYLAFHTVSGERGIFALLQENKKLDTLKAELAETKNKRETLEKKVQRISSNNLDLDLLDEQARRVLGITGKNEIVLFAEHGE